MKNEIEIFIDLIQLSGYSLSELGFSPGASNEEIKAIETVTGQVIPDELKLFLSYINGQNTVDFYFLPDQVRLFSCQEIIDEWNEEQVYAPDTEEFYNQFHYEDKIRNTIYHSTRVPFASQEGFGIVCIDNDPGPRGKAGQIIYLINECDFIVLADSFKEFISFYIECMRKGILKFENEKEDYPNKFRLKSDSEMSGLDLLIAFQLSLSN